MKQIKTTFAGGEFSEALDGRVDLSKYPTGAQLLENFYVTRFGGISNRQGTRYIDDALGNVRLIPFRFSVTQTYVLVFSENKMRVLKDGGMTGGEYEAVAVEPPGVLRIVPHVTHPQRICYGGESHGRPGMTGSGLLNGVHRQRSDGVDA